MRSMYLHLLKSDLYNRKLDDRFWYEIGTLEIMLSEALSEAN